MGSRADSCFAGQCQNSRPVHHREESSRWHGSYFVSGPKPSNILLTVGPGGEEARLADFGLAKTYQDIDQAREVTLPGTIGGSLAFTAPDQLSDFRRAGPLADQYSAAATLYYLLSGRLLHDVDSGPQMIERICHAEPVPLASRRAGLPEGLVAAIHQALQRDPKRRFSTAMAFRQALLPFADLL